MAKYVVVADIKYTGRMEVSADSAREARAIALDTHPENWDTPYGEMITITSTEELDD